MGGLLITAGHMNLRPYFARATLYFHLQIRLQNLYHTSEVTLNGKTLMAMGDAL